MKTIYLAGGLFNAAERLHNLYLEKQLVKLGYAVILPQRQALEFFKGDVFQLAEMVADCQRYSADPDVIFVGCLDGADADSGTAVEYGIAIHSKGKAVMYRTDFRTAIDRELGVNGMFHLKGTKIVYLPCFFAELHQVESYYAELAQKIHDAIESLA